MSTNTDTNKKKKRGVVGFLSPNVLLHRVGKFAHDVVDVVAGATAVGTNDATGQKGIGVPGTTTTTTTPTPATTKDGASDQPFVKHRHLRNIFAKPLSFVQNVVHGQKKKPGTTTTTTTEMDPSSQNFELPYFEHEANEVNFLKEQLSDHYLFESLEEVDLIRVAAAFECIKLPRKAIGVTNEDDDTIVIQQDEWVDDDNAYFYVLYKGRCQYMINKEIVGEVAISGDSFGELALLYNCPRAATVVALTSLSDVVLFRIHQTAFRLVLQNQNSTTSILSSNDEADRMKLKLLDGVLFLRQNASVTDLSTLAHAMKPRLYNKGEYITKVGDTINDWYIIERGTVRIDIKPNAGTVSSTIAAATTGVYSNVLLEHGDCFGEGSLLTNVPHDFDVIVESNDTLIFSVDKETFTSIVKDLKSAITQSVDCKKLKGIETLYNTISSSDSNRRVLNYLVSKIQTKIYSKGTVLCTQGDKIHHPALYLIRSGQVSIRKVSDSDFNKKEEDVLTDHGFFGDDQLLFDRYNGSVASYTATVISSELVVGVLTLEVCRKIMNTKKMGILDYHHSINLDSLKISGSTSEGTTTTTATTSNNKLSLNDLRLYKILGAGTFGQVWLVSRNSTDGTELVYALKIQSKYELIKNGQARGVIHEKQIMEQLHHPFVNGLVSSFHDTDYIYMLMTLIQGGELYTVMPQSNNTSNIDCINSETNASFYIAAIAEGLTYMHRRGYIFRDLKPENVLIDAQGYPVIIDFGFAKYVVDKTFTLCGTPLYIAPEVILNRGHNYGADHWSLGCMVYEMLTGRTPFYESGMDQSALFKSIVKGTFSMPRNITNEAQSIISGLLTRSASKRLGSAGVAGMNSDGSNFDDVLYHPWFAQIDHDALVLKEIQAPILPKIKDPLDGSNFVDWTHVEDKRNIKYPKLKQSDAKLFDDF